ncbi:hypothetical protein [Stutzerimonas xanthomarina]
MNGKRVVLPKRLLRVPAEGKIRNVRSVIDKKAVADQL